MGTETAPCAVCGETMVRSPLESIAQHPHLETCVNNLAQRLATLAQIVLTDGPERYMDSLQGPGREN